MSDMPQKIAAILKQRQSRLPKVQHDIQHWLELDQAIAALKASASDLPPPAHGMN